MLKQFWKDHKTASLIIVVFLLAILGFSIYSAYNQEQNVTPSAQVAKVAPAEQKDSKAEQKKEEDSSGELPYYITVVIIGILLVTLVIIAIQVFNENKGDWGKISLSPVGMALIAVLVLNLFAALGIPYYWLQFWNEHMFFFLFCTSAIVATHFYNKKSRAAHFVTYAICIIVAISAYNTYSSDLSLPSWKWSNRGSGSGHYAVRELKPGEWSKPPVVNPIGKGTMSWKASGISDKDQEKCVIKVDGKEKTYPFKYDFGNHEIFDSFEAKCEEPGVLIVDVARN